MELEHLVYMMYGFAYLSTHESRQTEWMKTVFSNVCDDIMDRNMESRVTFDQIALLAWSCIVAEQPHIKLFNHLFTATNDNKNPTPSQQFAVQMYQVHTDCLHKQGLEHFDESEDSEMKYEHEKNIYTFQLLKPSIADSFKGIMCQQQKHNTSSQLHRVVSETLKSMQVEHTNEFVVDEG